MWDTFNLQHSSQQTTDTLSENTNNDEVLSIMQTDDDEDELEMMDQFSDKETVLENQAPLSLFHIPQEVLSENPHFAKLLQSISNHISPESGVGKGEEEELERLEMQLEKEKEIYFKNTIILDAIHEMVDESHTSIQSSSSSSLLHSNNRSLLQTTLSQMSSLMVKSEIEIGMNISDTIETVNIYGLDTQILSDTIHEKGFENIQHNIKEIVYPELLQKWEGLYEDLLTFYQPFPEEATNLFATDTNNGKSNNNNNFTTIISKHLSSIKKEKHLILEQKQKLQEYTYTYFSKLAQCVQMLCTLINHYKCGEFRQYDESTLSWLIERTEAMKLKLCSIKYEYLVSIYDKDTVPIYYKMHQILGANYNKLEYQNNQLNAEIKKYSYLGEDFEKLVEEFAIVQKRINEKKWEIEQLHNPNDN